VIRKNFRWKRIKFNILLFGPFLVFGLLILLLGDKQDHGHSHSKAPVSQEAAKMNAITIITKLVKNNQLDKSWAMITAKSAEKKTFKGYKEWEVIFENKNITDPARQEIHVFLTLGGEHVAVNYSGN